MNNIFNPISTYRIQFHKDFNFDDFEKIIPYLDQLGIKTIYASPIFEAAPGSTHGYDGTDPNKINPEIGTQEQLLRISQELKRRNISWLQDIVPNHLSYHENNRWLMDVLEKGKDSEHAPVFDILWDHPDYPGKLMVPFPGSELEKLLKEKFPDEKNFALCSWQETDYRMNYRRFFLVNTLICTNIHDDKVFEKYHRLIRELAGKGIFQGLRVDHVDGLYDPTKYLKDLRKLAGDQSYIVVEKILEPGEEMPDYWPIQGNSGYDFLGMVNNVFTNTDAEYDLTTFYYDVTNDSTPVEKQIAEKKSMILHNYMAGELNNLVRLYKQVKGNSVEITDEQLKNHIAEYLVSCPVYRYYEEIPMMKIDEGTDPATMRPFYQRCMQFSGPLMAKGVEDTLMYTYNRFIGHNEVGDSPEFFGYTPENFHQLMQDRQRTWPLGMNSSSTHDTKRGEDVRARLNAMTDLHSEWLELVKSWQKENESLKKDGAPDKNDEYFIYQTLVGSFPVYSPSGFNENDLKAYPERLKEYLQKSLREAKLHSTWTEQNEEYENATIGFAHALLDQKGKFFKSFLPFLKKATDYGMINSFGQVVLKFMCPGVPDIYQGTELWDLSLVDPDNRRPVDYALRTQMMNEEKSLAQLWENRWDGKVKLRLLKRLLKVRAEFSDLLTEGDYIPLQVKGPRAENVLVFLRVKDNRQVLVAVPLHYAEVKNHFGNGSLLQADWRDTHIVLPDKQERKWNNLLSGGETIASAKIPVQQVFEQFIVAVLVS